MLDKTFAAMDSMMSAFSAEIRDLFKNGSRLGPKMARHRIVSKDGHITITGKFKTLTVNGKRIEKT